jgi:hypothetical protein
MSALMQKQTWKKGVDRTWCERWHKRRSSQLIQIKENRSNAAKGDAKIHTH